MLFVVRPKKPCLGHCSNGSIRGCILLPYVVRLMRICFILSVNYKEIWMMFKKKDTDFNITLYMVIAYIKC